VQVGEWALLDEIKSGGVVLFDFSGKARDYVGTDGGVRKMFADELDTARVVFGAIPAVHGRKDSVRTGLQRHVEVFGEARRRSEKENQIARSVKRLDGAQAKPFYAGFVEDFLQKVEEVAARRKVAAPGPQIDPAQNDFFVSGGREFTDFFDDSLRRQAAAPSADERNHAEGTAVVAAVLDFQCGAGVVPFPAENRCDEKVVQLKDVAGKDWSKQVVGGNKISWSAGIRRGDQEIGNLRFVGIADDVEDAGEGGEFFRGALGVAAGNDDSRGGIGGVEFADGIAGLGIGSGGDGAGV